MRKKEFAIRSSNGRYTIHGIVVLPDKEILGYIQIVHDMYDYIQRYYGVMEYFAQKGYLCFGSNLLGHGNSTDTSLGHMLNITYKDLVEDLHLSYQHILKQYLPNVSGHFIEEKQGENLQLIKPQLHAMLGIGFGCSLIRSYYVSYKDVNSLLFVGDMGFTTRHTKWLRFCEKEIRKQGEHGSSQAVREKMQEKWNTHCEGKCYRNSYRVSDVRLVRSINADANCNFEYTNGAMSLLLSVLCSMSLTQWLNLMPKYMPMYELSGYLDPINNYTRELDDMLTKFRFSSKKNVFYKYYENAYHELLFDKGGKEALADIVKFLDGVYKGMMQTYESQKQMLEKEREDK